MWPVSPSVGGSEHGRIAAQASTMRYLPSSEGNRNASHRFQGRLHGSRQALSAAPLIYPFEDQLLYVINRGLDQ